MGQCKSLIGGTAGQHFLRQAVTHKYLIQRVRQLLKNRKEAFFAGSLLLGALGLLAFLALASEVQEQEYDHYDRAILLSLREPHAPHDPLGPPWVEEMGRDLTALGGFAILTIVTLVSLGFMLLLCKPRLAALTTIAVLGGMFASSLLKLTFARSRPDVVPHGMLVTSASFPSGHAMMAATVYLALGVLLARTQIRKTIRLYVIGVSTMIAVLVGISRVYLGVHWPTDVLGGWILGAVSALLFWVFANRLDPIK